MTEPLVSIVIPAFNAERHIERCLRSIRSLENAHVISEVVILDNGSTDRTVEIARTLGFAPRLLPGGTVSALRNQGARLCRGAYLAFVDSDVELLPNWLRAGLAIFQDGDVVAAGCFPGVPRNATWVQRAWDLHQRGRVQDRLPRPVAWLSSMNLLVRRLDFLAVGGFNEQLETAEDVDLCYRLGRRGRIIYNPDMVAVHWGEAPDLRTFWRKEVWRGLGNFRGVLSHGLRWDELPSLGYPLYTLGVGLLAALAAAVDYSRHEVLMTPCALALWFLPPLLLSWHTAGMAGRLTGLPSLFLLYWVYGLARAFAVIRAGIGPSKPARPGSRDTA